MKKGKEFIHKIVLCLFVMLISSLSVNAANNSLTGIDVKENAQNGYNVILKLAGNANIKKLQSNGDSLMLVINSTIPSDAMEIVYDNTSNINNVIVQKKNTDNTMVVLQGKNIENANIYTKNIITGALTPISSSQALFSPNKKIMSFSIALMFLWFLTMVAVRRNRNKQKAAASRKAIENAQMTIRNRNLAKSKNAPSIGYTSQNHVSAPKDFVINRYMENEKIRKAS